MMADAARQTRLTIFRYVDANTASQNGYISEGDTAVMSVDTTNKWPNGGKGRPATRIISNNAYTHGLFILDLVHMPWGCGTWPAYWLLGPDPWATNGEIDIIEGVNTGLSNSISMHTEPGCTIAGSGQTATFETSNCDHNANGNSGCGSLLDNNTIPNNYGDSLNDNGGGVYATEWTSEYVKHWFFPRNAIPANVGSDQPDPSTWGIPTVNAQGSCDIDSNFANMSIIFNTDFCGAWAGQVYQSQFPQCPQTAGASSLDSCVDFVGETPSYFEDAYWEINSLRVYQMPQGAEASSSYTTSLSSIVPAVSTAGTSALPVGPGVSTQEVSSAPYSGPTSSGTRTASVPASASTPAICPDYNGTTWTDNNNQQYTIACGSDYQGSGAVYAAQSFENCMEICDNYSGDNNLRCVAVSFVGGNGAGTCYIKTSDGVFLYDGSTNAAARISAAAPASSSVDAPLISSQLTTTESVASATSSAVSCQNNTLQTDAQGVTYMLYCDADSNGSGAFATKIFDSNFTQCESYCDETENCGAWTWAPGASGGGFCYLKQGPQQPVFGSPGLISGVRATEGSGDASSAIISARSTMDASTPSASSTTSDSLTSMSSSSSPSASALCPYVDGKELTDSSGNSYTIHCSADTSGSGGGSIASQMFDDGDFTQCMTACDTQSGCAAWVWAAYTPSPGGICYLKEAPQSAIAGPDNQVAGLLSLPQSATIATTNSAGATTSTTGVSTNVGLSSSAESAVSTVAVATSTGGISSSSTMASSSVAPSMSSAGQSAGSSELGTASTATAASASSSLLGASSMSVSAPVSSNSFLTASISISGASSTIGIEPSSYLEPSVSGVSSPAASSSIAASSSSIAMASSLSNGISGAYTTASPTQSSAGASSISAGTTSSSLFTPGPSQTPTFTAPPADQPAPTCADDPADSCEHTGDQSVCSSEDGTTYGLVCGVAYEGAVLNPPTTRRRRQTSEPSFQDCTALCDTTAGCVALNYVNTDCTLFSFVTGTYALPGAVGASQVTPPTTTASQTSGSETVTVTPSTTLCKLSPSTRLSLPCIGSHTDTS